MSVRRAGEQDGTEVYKREYEQKQNETIYRGERAKQGRNRNRNRNRIRVVRDKNTSRN